MSLLISFNLFYSLLVLFIYIISILFRYNPNLDSSFRPVGHQYLTITINIGRFEIISPDSQIPNNIFLIQYLQIPYHSSRHYISHSRHSKHYRNSVSHYRHYRNSIWHFQILVVLIPDIILVFNSLILIIILIIHNSSILIIHNSWYNSSILINDIPWPPMITLKY